MEGQELCPGHWEVMGEVEVGRGQGSSGLLEVGGGLEGETRDWEGFLSWKR